MKTRKNEGNKIFEKSLWAVWKKLTLKTNLSHKKNKKLH
jgi:hypothetical protein